MSFTPQHNVLLLLLLVSLLQSLDSTHSSPLIYIPRVRPRSQTWKTILTISRHMSSIEKGPWMGVIIRQ